LRCAAATALITGLAAFAAPVSDAPAARHADTRQALTAAAVTGAKTLTLSNGTRVVVDAPWAATAGHSETASRVGNLTGATRGGYFCFYGAAQTLGPQAAPAQTKATKYTLTIKGFDLSGKPSNLDGWVQVFSATSMKWNENTIGPDPAFRHGVVTMHVPAGKYWLVGQFRSAHSFRMDIPAQHRNDPRRLPDGLGGTGLR
jgi:hypothetical protein